MARRTAITLLLVAYLAGQWAAIPHAHAEGSDTQHSDHGTQPHVHVSWFGDHDHDHKHGSGHHDHHGDKSHSHHAAENSTDLADGNCEGHDSDAVYLPEEVARITVTAKVTNLVDESQYSPLLMMEAAIARPQTVADFESARIAEECSPGCPLFLALRALRI